MTAPRGRIPGDPVGLGHRLGPVRRGPILPPRPLDAEPSRPRGIRLRTAVGTFPPLRSEGECAAVAARAGWTLARVQGGRSRRTQVVFERNVRMDLTALRRTRLLLVAFAVEFLLAILLGVGASYFGFALWAGELLIVLGIVGAAGFVVLLPRVDFVSEVAVVQLAGAGPDRETGSGPGPPSLPVYEWWAAEMRTRNWEVLGDRGGRRVLRIGRSEAAESSGERLGEALGDSLEGIGPTIRSAGFK